MKQHTFNLDNLDPSTVPMAPLGAFDDADWHDVPEGYYLLPVHDWSKFGDDCGPDDETPELDLLGFRVFVRQVPTLIKTGKRAGQTIGKDRFIIGQLVLARGVQERVIQRRTKRRRPKPRQPSATRRCSGSSARRTKTTGSRAEHEFMRDGDTSPACRCCPDCITNAGRWPSCRWKPAPDQANAYANEVAAALIHSIKNESDAFRKLYGQLTGHCGKCGRFIYDPESKRLGIGPDCGGQVTTLKPPRHVRQQLAALRSEWRLWRRGGPHPAFGLVCPAQCDEPACEACAATAYRADRRAELAVRAAEFKALWLRTGRQPALADRQGRPERHRQCRTAPRGPAPVTARPVRPPRRSRASHAALGRSRARPGEAKGQCR